MRLKRFRYFFVFLLIVTGIEVSVWYLIDAQSAYSQLRFYPAYYSPTVDDSILHWQSEYSRSLSAEQDILVFGCSSGLMGLRSRVMSEELGLNVWTFSTLALVGIEGSHIIRDDYLQNHAPPKLFILHLSEKLITRDWRFVLAGGKIQSFKRWQQKVTGAHHRYIPSMILRDVSWSYLIPAAEQERMLNKSRGHYPSDRGVQHLLFKQRGNLEESTPPRYSRVQRFRKDADAHFLQQLSSFVSTAEAMGVPVLLVLNPIPEFHRTPANEKQLQRLKAQIQDALTKNVNVHFMTPFIRFYPDHVTSDPTHLLAAGAMRNTYEVGNMVKTILNG